MNIIEVITLFGIMAALAAIPSSSVVLVITRSAVLGIANGIAVSVGIIFGDLIFVLLAIYGLSVVAETMGSLFMVIKYLGAVYLIWFGFKLLTSKKPATASANQKIGKCDLATSFLSGFFITLGDIKAIIFYGSLFPIYLDLSALQLNDILTIVSVVVFSVGGVKILYAFSAAKITSTAGNLKFDSAIKKMAGSLLLGAGGYLIVKS